MGSALAFMPKFFVLSGAILVVSGVAQVFVRPRKAKETLADKIFNGAALRAVVFVTCGILGVLLGLGVVPMLHLR